MAFPSYDLNKLKYIQVKSGLNLIHLLSSLCDKATLLNNLTNFAYLSLVLFFPFPKLTSIDCNLFPSSVPLLLFCSTYRYLRLWTIKFALYRVISILYFIRNCDFFLLLARKMTIHHLLQYLLVFDIQSTAHALCKLLIQRD